MCLFGHVTVIAMQHRIMGSLSGEVSGVVVLIKVKKEWRNIYIMYTVTINACYLVKLCFLLLVFVAVTGMLRIAAELHNEPASLDLKS